MSKLCFSTKVDYNSVVAITQIREARTVTKNNAFVTYVVEDLLGAEAGIAARAMFGGYGLYKKGQIFGMIVDDVLYFKVGESNKADYQEAGSNPFTYQAKTGQRVAMSYWEVPADVLESPREIKRWLDKSLAVAQSTKSKKKR